MMDPVARVFAMDSRKRITILVIDDDPEILDLITMVLRREYIVVKATSGSEAMEIIQKNAPALVLTDQWMGDVTGIEILAYLHEKHPEVGRVLITGFPDLQVVKDAINKGHVHRFITKPWEMDEMRSIVAEEVERHRALVEHRHLLNDLMTKNKELTLANEEIMAQKRRLEELNQEYKEQSQIAIELSEKFAQAHLELLEAQEEIQKKNKQLQKANRELEKLSVTDGLTGFYNFRHLEVLLEREIGRASRYNLQMTCMMVDLDDFKKVNDTYGHLFGDEVLRTVAGIVQKNIRETDLPARYGGDEFFVILPHTDLEQARALAQRIFDDIQDYDFKPGNDLHFQQKVSIGLASFEADRIQGREQMIEWVDSALYQAKRAGRNMIVIYNAPEADVTG